MGVPEPALWIREADVAALLSLGEAIDVLADAYRLQARGQAASMSRAHVREGASILHAVGGTILGAGLCGTKTWTYTPGGASPLLVLFSLDDGRVLAVIEAFALGQMRTAATSGLGTRLLAPADAATMALLGTGKQAFSQAHAVACVRPIRRVRLFGRDPGRRQVLADRLAGELELEVSQHEDVADALAGADVVTSITRAAEPVVQAGMLAAGMHLNAVGAIVPSRRELDAAAVGRCATVVVDSVDQAHHDAGELLAAVDAHELGWERVSGLDQVMDRSAGELRKPDDITLFKALGVGLSDVALGAEVLRRAHAAELGQPLPQTTAAHH